jgi:hypothetical protein
MKYTCSDYKREGGVTYRIRSIHNTKFSLKKYKTDEAGSVKNSLKVFPNFSVGDEDGYGEECWGEKKGGWEGKK